MSECRQRLYTNVESERYAKDSCVKTRLFYGLPEFEDLSEEEDDGGLVVDLDSSSGYSGTPLKSFTGSRNVSSSAKLWDSGLGSPTPGSLTRRTANQSPKFKLSPISFTLGSDDEAVGVTPLDYSPPPSPTPVTPPHKKFRSLRLYDTPHTPKSLLQRATRRISRGNRTRLLSDGTQDKDHSKLMLSADRPQTNINPFTTTEKHGTKRNRSTLDGFSDDSFDSGEDGAGGPMSKKLALHEINTSRYNEEFYEVCKLGDGEFGSVFKCINRLDGCTYAIKKSKKPVAGSAYERSALNEVYAHAVLGKHEHMVRYYSAWAENDHMFIQNEYCNGGSLQDVLVQNRMEGRRFSELDLKLLLFQVAQGLKYIHSQQLVHLDIKPGNIFIHYNPQGANTESGVEEDFGEEEDEKEDTVIYKIGDLGHVTSVIHPQVEEGDCRYLPQEILHEEFDHLQKADIFSLALTVLEAGGIGELPKNGEEWHVIRNGHLPELEHCSKEFNNLLTTMVHPDPAARPSATALTQHPVLCPFAKKSRAQLRRELNEEKLKNEKLSRELQAAKQRTQSKAGFQSKGSRMVGRGFSRSSSTRF